MRKPLPQEPWDSLQLEPAQMADMVDAARDAITAYMERLPTMPSVDLEGANELARSLREPLPKEGRPHRELIDEVMALLPKSVNTNGLGYFGYMGGGGIFHAAVASLLANAVNRYVGLWFVAPPLVQIEANVIRWFNEIIGYPELAGGVMTTGGSMSNFTAVIAARREMLPENFLSGTVYVSDQAHHSVDRAITIAGFPTGALRKIPTDENFRIRPDLLQQRIAEDRQKGLTPFLIVANAGTTNTGAVDDLGALADIAQREKLWMHVDAAYGGFFMLTEQGKKALRGIERADSVAVDAHKSLFLPYGTGALLVKKRDPLRKAFVGRGEYLPELEVEEDFWDFGAMSAELSRDFRGLRVWLPLKMHGSEVFRRALQDRIDWARHIADEVQKIEGIRLICQPQLSVVNFRLERPGASQEELNKLNEQLLERVKAKKRVFIIGTTLRGQFVIRICVLSFRLKKERIEMALEDLREAVRELNAAR